MFSDSHEKKFKLWIVNPLIWNLSEFLHVKYVSIEAKTPCVFPGKCCGTGFMCDIMYSICNDVTLFFIFSISSLKSMHISYR